MIDIKNMKIPACCQECEFLLRLGAYYQICSITHSEPDKFATWQVRERAPDCKLVDTSIYEDDLK